MGLDDEVKARGDPGGNEATRAGRNSPILVTLMLCLNRNGTRYCNDGCEEASQLIVSLGVGGELQGQFAPITESTAYIASQSRRRSLSHDFVRCGD